MSMYSYYFTLRFPEVIATELGTGSKTFDLLTIFSYRPFSLKTLNISTETVNRTGYLHVWTNVEYSS